MDKSFCIGLVTGLVVASFARRTKVQRVTQQRLDDYYHKRARNYSLTDKWISPRVTMRKTLISMADLKPGDHVLDVACGTGDNFALILEKIGPNGSLIGTDFSQDMLDAAAEMVKEKGWDNVKLVRADAAKMSFNTEFDCVLCTMGFAVIPNHQDALQKAWDHVKPGGTLAVGDIQESNRWYTKAFGFLTDFVDAFIIADSSRKPWEWMAANGDNYQRQEIFHGYFYAAVINRPKKQQ